MKKTEQRFTYILNWEDSPPAPKQTDDQWSVEVSTEYPRLLKKLGGHPQRFVAPTLEGVLAAARGFVDSLSLF